MSREPRRPVYRLPTDQDTSDLLAVARAGEPGIQANNRMVYHLACTVFAASTLVAEVGGEVVGFVIGLPYSDRSALWIHQLVVRDEWRRQGIGAALLAEGRKAARRLELRELRLLVRPDNPARRLYESVGYARHKAGDAAGMLCYRLATGEVA
jgi:ribosomal protein S18 acetylase RimI-like enzyme